MTTLRQRFQYYWRADSEFPETPEGFNCSRVRKIAGSVIVAVTGFVLAAPFGWALLQAAGDVIPGALASVLALSLYFIASWFSKYVGGPVADHLLGIPREEAR